MSGFGRQRHATRPLVTCTADFEIKPSNTMEKTIASYSILFRLLGAFILTRAVVSATPLLFAQSPTGPSDGAITISDGGIIDFQKGRTAMIRDSDVGGYIMLWQPGR